MKRSLATAFTAKQLQEAVNLKRRKFISTPKYTPRARPKIPIRTVAMRTGGFVSPVLGGELKFIDTSITFSLPFSATTFITPGGTNLLNGLARGTQMNQRVGRKVTMKSLLIRGTFQIAATSTGNAPCRVMVVYDRQTNTTAPAITDVLLSDEFLSQNNLSNRERFSTICDYITKPVGGGSNLQEAFTIFKKLDNPIMFNDGNAGTVGDISMGSIYMLVSQAGGIATANPTLTVKTRIRFTDV